MTCEREMPKSYGVATIGVPIGITIGVPIVNQTR